MQNSAIAQQGKTHIEFTSNLDIIKSGDLLVYTPIFGVCADFELFF